MFYRNVNEENNHVWLKKTLSSLPQGACILDAGRVSYTIALCNHLSQHGFRIEELTPNGDWFEYCRQELMRLGSTARRYGDWSWPLDYVLSVLDALCFKVRGGKHVADLACFGWHCVAVKN